eukprot:986642-Pelagomonas_calceolata.AAC.1
MVPLSIGPNQSATGQKQRHTSQKGLRFNPCRLRRSDAATVTVAESLLTNSKVFASPEVRQQAFCYGSPPCCGATSQLNRLGIDAPLPKLLEK